MQLVVDLWDYVRGISKHCGQMNAEISSREHPRMFQKLAEQHSSKWHCSARSCQL
jgi:hypothetical protein